MDERVGADEVIVARVRLAHPDGSEETWLVPMRLADDALTYVAAIYPSTGAVVIGVDPLKRARETEQEIVIARADVAAR
jgi:hypothetical protein